MHRGYIKLYRAMIDNHLWGHKPFSYGQAWVHMLMVANHKEGTIWANKTPVKIARGQLGWSQDRLASEFGWTRQQVRTFLNHLKRDHMINQDGHGRMSIITIVNYEKYHGDNQIVTQPVTNPQPDDNQPVTTNKNDKNNKNVKKEYINPRLGEFENVLLTKKDMDTLIKGTPAYPSMIETRRTELIENLSAHIAKVGNKYKNHYATIQTWNRRDGSGATKPKAPTMTAEQEGKRKMLKNELAASYDTLDAKKQVPEGHPIYAAAQREIKSINKRIDEIERELG